MDSPASTKHQELDTPCGMPGLTLPLPRSMGTGSQRQPGGVGLWDDGVNPSREQKEFSMAEPYHYLTGKRGKGWTRSLLHAQRAGAIIVTDDGLIPVSYDRNPTKYRGLCWVDAFGNRYDSRELHPKFPSTTP